MLRFSNLQEGDSGLDSVAIGYRTLGVKLPTGSMLLFVVL